MVEYQPGLDATFAAVADPTRRRILETLTEREASVGELAEPFDMSFQAVSKHIGVLDAAGLVAREKRGRVQWCRLTPAPMQAADEWMGTYRDFWGAQLDALRASAPGAARRRRCRGRPPPTLSRSGAGWSALPRKCSRPGPTRTPYSSGSGGR